MIASSMLELVGHTPLVRIRGGWLREGANIASVWAKMEHLNPGGSVKDRICRAMIEDAEARGTLQPPGPIVEPTSGNTGIGLAFVCSVKGYRLILTMPESMSLERRQLLEAYGAEIVLTPAEEQMDGAIVRARSPRRRPARTCRRSSTMSRTRRCTRARRRTRSSPPWTASRSTRSSPA
jgi:cysteine synthase A